MFLKKGLALLIYSFEFHIVHIFRFFKLRNFEKQVNNRQTLLLKLLLL